jgi:hypothetical protein
MANKLPKDARGYDLGLAEPYLDDGEPAVAMIFSGIHLKLRTITEWKETEPELGEYLQKQFFPPHNKLVVLPSKPILPENDEDLRNLHMSIQRCNDEYIDFPRSQYPSVFATWEMGSYFTPFIPRSQSCLLLDLQNQVRDRF